MENFSQIKKIAILGETKDIIFFRGLGIEIIPVKEEAEEILDSLEKRDDLGIIFISQELLPKIKKEKLERWQKKMLPVLLPLPLKEKRGVLDLMSEVLKRAIGKEITI